MKKILVTGSGTLIGGTIAKFLNNNGYDVISIYNRSKPKIKGKRIQFLKKNLEKEFKINSKIDCIVHCASKIPDDGNSNKIMSLNLKMLKNLIGKKNINFKKIIFLSTMSVYGEITKKIINENTPFKNLDPYGKSKRKCEEFIKKKINKKKLFTIFRLPGVVGKKSSHNFMSKIIRDIKTNKEIKITNPNSYFNNIVHVDTISKLILHSIEFDNSNNIYNVSSSKPLKIKDCIKILLTFFKKKISLEELKSDKKSFMINTSRIIKNGYPIISTKQSLKKFYESNIS